MSDISKPVRRSLHFPSRLAMAEWVQDMADQGSFGTTKNPLVPTVEDPISDIGVRPFDSVDQGRASNSEHYALDRVGEAGAVRLEDFN